VSYWPLAPPLLHRIALPHRAERLRIAHPRYLELGQRGAHHLPRRSGGDRLILQAVGWLHLSMGKSVHHPGFNHVASGILSSGNVFSFLSDV